MRAVLFCWDTSLRTPLLLFEAEWCWFSVKELCCVRPLTAFVSFALHDCVYATNIMCCVTINSPHLWFRVLFPDFRFEFSLLYQLSSLRSLDFLSSSLLLSGCLTSGKCLGIVSNVRPDDRELIYLGVCLHACCAWPGLVCVWISCFNQACSHVVK